MIIVKLICMLVSVVITVYGVHKLNTLPCDKYTVKGNYIRADLYPGVGMFYDIIMSFILWLCVIPEGEYGSIFTVTVPFIPLLLYPYCAIVHYKLKKRMREYNEEKYKRWVLSDATLEAPIAKMFLFFFISVWLEVN